MDGTNVEFNLDNILVEESNKTIYDFSDNVSEGFVPSDPSLTLAFIGEEMVITANLNSEGPLKTFSGLEIGKPVNISTDVAFVSGFTEGNIEVWNEDSSIKLGERKVSSEGKYSLTIVPTTAVINYKFSNSSSSGGETVSWTMDNIEISTNETNFIAEVSSYSDFYPFGMQMPGRHGSSDDYRYGFQGQERDKETGLDNYKYRMHDPRIGRFFAVDPLAPDYPHNSPYAFSENRVTNSVELEGREANDNFVTVGAGVSVSLDKLKNSGKKYLDNGFKFGGFVGWQNNFGAALLNLSNRNSDFNGLSLNISYTPAVIHETSYNVSTGRLKVYGTAIRDNVGFLNINIQPLPDLPDRDFLESLNFEDSGAEWNIGIGAGYNFKTNTIGVGFMNKDIRVHGSSPSFTKGLGTTLNSLNKKLSFDHSFGDKLSRLQGRLGRYAKLKRANSYSVSDKSFDLGHPFNDRWALIPDPIYPNGMGQSLQRINNTKWIIMDSQHVTETYHSKVVAWDKDFGFRNPIISLPIYWDEEKKYVEKFRKNWKKIKPLLTD